jgi:hypothetical protein
MLRIFILIQIMTLFFSCKIKSRGIKELKNERQRDQIEIDLNANVEGEYLAILHPVNEIVTGQITGAFTFSRDIEFNEVITDVRLNNSGYRVIHTQSVKLAQRCPDFRDDANHDGIIDIIEEESLTGKVFIPLDGDISSQDSHDGEYPVSDDFGSYIYSQQSDFTSFMSDLRSHTDQSHYIKLAGDEKFQIEGAIVIIYGINESVNLPLTVSADGRRSRHQSIPIACGTIRKVYQAPGEIELPTLPDEFP